MLVSGQKGRDDQWYKMMTQRQKCPPPQKKNQMIKKTYMIKGRVKEKD